MILFPTPPNDYSQSWASQLIQQIQAALGFCAKTDAGVGRIILQSPNGQSWAVTVNDSGSLVVTVMNGTER